MSDYLTSLMEVPRKFTKESTQLLQRCTKPDRRGMKESRFFVISLTSCRVRKDDAEYRNWVFGDGIYWLCYQAHPHSY